MPIDMSLAAPKAPPRKRTSNAAPASAKVISQDVRTPGERRAKGLMEIAQLVQGGFLMFGQYADAAAIGQHFQPVAIELANVAESSEVIAKPIDFLIEVGPYGALIAAVMPLGLQIAANHGWVNAEMLMGHGVVPPVVLEAQMKAQMARMQSEAMRAQQLAMKEAAAAQAEYEQALQDQKAA